MAIDTGNGATLTLSNFTANITRLACGEQTIDMLDASHLGTTTYIEKIEADLADGGDLSIDFLFDPTLDYPTIGQGPELGTVTFDLQSGTTEATYKGTGVVSGIGFPELANNELMEGSITFTFDGGYDSGTEPTWTKEA